MYTLNHRRDVSLKERKKKMGEYIVETKNLTKNYGKFCALNRVEISVKRGEIIGIFLFRDLLFQKVTLNGR